MKNLNKILFFISLFFLSYIFSVLQNETDLDLWHRMAVGKIFSQLGNVIYHDIFAYFPSKPLWIDHEWLSGVVFYNLGQVFGDCGFLILKTFIYFSILVLIYKTHKLIQKENPDKISFYILTLISLTPGIASVLRCQAFTFLFFALWIYVLERIRRGENKLIWIFPATTLLWANMHGGFISGFGLIIFYLLGEFINKKPFLKYLGILALCLPVTLINPYGIKYWPYLIETLLMKKTGISEWGAFNFLGNISDDIGFKIFVLVFLASVAYKILSKDQKIDWVKAIALLATLFLSVKHNRHVVFFSILASVYCYNHFLILCKILIEKINIFKNIPERSLFFIKFSKQAFVYILIFSLFINIFVSTPLTMKLSHYPTKAVEFIKINKLEGNLLVPFNWGSYAMWKLYPQNLVSIDGRYEETYTSQSFNDMSVISFCDEKCEKTYWEKIFNKYHHNILLVDKNNMMFRKLKNWKIIYEDEKAIVFVPLATPDKKWLQPDKDENYYIKNKYENNINF